MRVTTSGHGGQLPPGLPIGRVSAVSESLIAVQPFVDFSRLEHVAVADWSLESRMSTAETLVNDVGAVGATKSSEAEVLATKK